MVELETIVKKYLPGFLIWDFIFWNSFRFTEKNGHIVHRVPHYLTPLQFPLLLSDMSMEHQL